MNNGGSIKKEWNGAAEAWVDFVRKGKDYFRDGLNNPAAFKLIGDIKGQNILDLACGEGYNTRLLAKSGANVIGVDVSDKLIEFAKREERREKLGIRYYKMDAAKLHGFSDNEFDLVTCFMALQDIEEYEEAIGEVARVLRKRGRFVFSIPHPCFETITVNGKRFRAVDKYFVRIKYPIHWNMERLTKPFKTMSFHRTLTDYSKALSENRFFISRLVEPQPTEKAVKKYPTLKDELVKPQSMIIESVKIPDSHKT